MTYNYKNPLSITSQFSFCGLPFRLDTYSGCSFNCIYCFSHKRGGNSNFHETKVADPNIIINRFKNATNHPSTSTGLISQLIRRKMPIHFGGMSDPFQEIEKTEQVSYLVLEYLSSIKYPVVISTKSTLLSSPKYLKLIQSNENIIVQFSYSTLNELQANILEPNCESPKKRLESQKILSDSGIKTMIRWQPYIIGISEEPIDFVSSIKDIKIKHLTIEFLKLPIDNKNAWNNSLLPLVAIRELYKNNNSLFVGRELTLLPENKIEIIQKLKIELKKNKISLGIGDNELQHFSETLCCCGIDQFSGFENWNTSQFSYAIKKSTNKKICFDTITNEWRPGGSIDKHLNSKSRMQKTTEFKTVFDYLQSRWNNVNSDFNPSKYYGVTDSGLKDENGFCIFDVENF